MKSRIITILIYFPCCFLLSALIINTYFKTNSKNVIDFVNGNILFNSNFENGFKFWKYEDGISLTNINNKIYVKLFKEKQKHISFYQDINVISGCIYRLSFSLKGKQDGAYAFYRDKSSGKENYMWCNGKYEEAKAYIWDFKPEKTCKYSIHFSVNSKGDYYFSNISLTNCSKNCKIRTLLLFSVTLSLSLFLSIFLYFILFGKSYYNIFFSVIILILATLPVAKIDKSKKSLSENRNLANYKPLFKNGSLNKSYGKNFNDYLNDRFWGKSLYLQFFTLTRAFINQKIDSKEVYAGDEKWYFRKENLNSLNAYNEDKPDNYSKLVKNLKRISRFCDENNTELYILVLPCNEEVYSEKLDGINLGHKKYAINQTINKLRVDTGVNIIYGSEAMENAKLQGYACYKTDHHWTELGAFYGYKRIMEEITKKFNDIIPLSYDEFEISDNSYSYSIGSGSIYSMLNLPKWTFNYFYPIDSSYLKFDYKRARELRKENEIMLNKNGNNYSVLVFGDSMTENIINFFWATFSKTLQHVEYGYMNMKSIEKRILKYKPDIAVMIVYYHNFEGIKFWYEQ